MTLSSESSLNKPAAGEGIYHDSPNKPRNPEILLLSQVSSPVGGAENWYRIGKAKSPLCPFSSLQECYRLYLKVAQEVVITLSHKSDAPWYPCRCRNALTQPAQRAGPLPQQAQTRFRWCGVNRPERMTNHVRGAQPVLPQKLRPRNRLCGYRNIRTVR